MVVSAVNSAGTPTRSDDGESLQTRKPIDHLPDDIIEQILQNTDPNGFASLILLNRKWRTVSQQAHLYLHHLAQCSSYCASRSTLPSADSGNLPQLRRLFAREAKRNLFEAYLRPAQTTIKLVSTAISSSSCPGGEGLQFCPSPLGHHILAYNSSRIHVIDVRSSEIDVKRELKILRRPVSACIKDDGTLLAVLSSEMQVELYDLQVSPPRRKQTIILDNTPRAIAISPCGSVLAAAYEGGIEVSSLNAQAVPSERRAVKCDGVDALTFSFDGTQILGTTTHSSPSNTVILTAPYYDPENQVSLDNLSAMWTTSILFPNSSRDCSHAVLLQDGSHEEASWTFTYDRNFETFRAVRLDDLRNGTTYFTGPTADPNAQSKLLPSTLPSATYRGETVAAGFQGKDLWVYGVPQSFGTVSDSHSLGEDISTLGQAHSASQPSLSRQLSTRSRNGSGEPAPQWQLLCEQGRNQFMTGSKVAEIQGLSVVKWVSGSGTSSLRERMIAGAKGVSGPRLISEEEDFDFVDGGRLVLLDFDYTAANGEKTEITIEIGSDGAEVLEEEQRDLATEVALVRRRTVAQKRGGRTGLLRSATTSAANMAVPPVPDPVSDPDANDDPLVPRRMGQNPTTRIESEDNPEEEVATIEEQEALDAPYSHTSPRSGTTLRRAATAVAVNRRLNPRTADGRPIEYRRADGRREHPHESDADNWVPPPPPYQKDDPGDTPVFLRGPAVTPPVPALPSTHGLGHWTSNGASRTTNGYAFAPSATMAQHSPEQIPLRPAHHRTNSDSTTLSRPRASETPRPMSSPSIQADFNSLYDVTPPPSPRPLAAAPAAADSGSAIAAESPEEFSVPAVMPVSPESATRRKPVPAPEQRLPTSAGIPDQVETRTALPLDEPNEPLVSTSQGTPLPVLGLHIPTTSNFSPQQTNEPSSSTRRLSNPRTWPLVPRVDEQREAPIMAGHPFSAPVERQPVHDQISDLPPAPSSSQLASLNKRISQGNPRRFSGVFQSPPTSAGSHQRRWSYGQFPPPSSHVPQPIPRHSESQPDLPLIISTPGGLSGAFDEPKDPRASLGPASTPLLAPVPRHPNHGSGSFNRAAVERLETIYSHNEPSDEPAASAQQQKPTLLPSWLTRKSGSQRKGSVRRKPSRAKRGATKNIRDARMKGWAAKGKPQQSTQGQSRNGTGEWQDISPFTAPKTQKDGKCTVM